MKVVFIIPGLMESEVREIPDNKPDWRFVIRPPITSMAIKEGRTPDFPISVRELVFRNTKEIHHYTAKREPVFIFQLT